MLQVRRDQQFAEELERQERLQDHCAKKRHRAVEESETDTFLVEEQQAAKQVCTSAALLPIVAHPAHTVLHLTRAVLGCLDCQTAGVPCSRCLTLMACTFAKSFNIAFRASLRLYSLS